ncbi:MAG: DUF192 domain-containing protein [Bryobacterales bacterium]|nr:DUF192 domain-containing protein [Bryobacterales bacterium]
MLVHLSIRVRNATRGKILGEAIEIAGSSATRRTGLLKHSQLKPGEGLWIAPCEAIHTFGMKFAIDVAFLDRKKSVRKVRHSLPARRMALSLLSHSVLELPAGTLAETGTEPGDQLVFEKVV